MERNWGTLQKEDMKDLRSSIHIHEKWRKSYGNIFLKHLLSIIHKIQSPALAEWLHWLKHHPIHQKVASLIPTRDACSTQLISVSLSHPYLSLINKYILRWRLEKKKSKVQSHFSKNKNLQENINWCSIIFGNWTKVSLLRLGHKVCGLYTSCTHRTMRYENVCRDTRKKYVMAIIWEIGVRLKKFCPLWKEGTRWHFAGSMPYAERTGLTDLLDACTFPPQKIFVTVGSKEERD